MIDLITKSYPHYTIGQFEVAGISFLTLELPNLNNEPFVSCIAGGIVRFHRDKTGKHQFYRAVSEDVAPRTDIEIHPAKYPRHLQGCIAPCFKLVEDGNGKTETIQSLEACEKLIELFGDSGFVMRIIRQ